MGSQPSSETSFSNGGGAIILPNIMDIKSCNKLLQTFHELLNSSTQKYVMDAGAVERISTPGIQLFLAFFKTSGSTGKESYIAGNNNTLASAFADLGLIELYKNYTKGK